MDPEKPKPKQAGPKPKQAGPKPKEPVKKEPVKGEDKSRPSTGPPDKARPVLTERQRAEARRLRRQGRKPRASSRKKGNALSRGVRATGSEVTRTMLFLGRSVLSALDVLRPVGGIVVGALLAVAGFIGTAFAFVVRAFRSALAFIGRVWLALDRVITPRRAIAVASIAAGGLLVASQFIISRAIEIGQPGYVAVQTITHAPRVEQMTPTDMHSYLLVAAGLLAFAAGLLSLVSDRRILGLVIAAAGGMAIALTLAVDLHKALDTTTASLAFSGVNAILLSGFWLELGAGIVLAVTGIATVLAPRTARVRARRPERPGRSRRTPLESQGSRA